MLIKRNSKNLELAARCTTVQRLEDIQNVRSYWEKWQNHPHSNINAYIEDFRIKKNLLSPYLMLVSKADEAKALIIGRILQTELNFKIAYLSVYRTKAKVLQILDNGVLGDVKEEEAHCVINHIVHMLKNGEADMAHIAGVRVDSPLYALGKKLPVIFSKGYFSFTENRRILHLPERYEIFIKSLRRKTRQTILSSNRKIEKDFSNRLKIITIIDPKDIPATLDDIEEIAVSTYQRAIGTGFMNTSEQRSCLESFAKLKMLSIDLLYIDKKPIAFWYGTQYKNIYYPEATGYNPKFASYRPGDYLLLKLIERHCIEGKVNTIDFGIGDALYKKLYSNDVLVQAHVRIFAPTLKGLKLNLARSLTLLAKKISVAFLKKISLYDSLKRNLRLRLKVK